MPPPPARVDGWEQHGGAVRHGAEGSPWSLAGCIEVCAGVRAVRRRPSTEGRRAQPNGRWARAKGRVGRPVPGWREWICLNAWGKAGGGRVASRMRQRHPPVRAESDQGRVMATGPPNGQRRLAG